MYIANIIFQIHQGLSAPDQPEILFCETPAKLADNPFSC